MKVLAVIGSVRKAATYDAVRLIEEKLKKLGKESLEFEYLFLKDVNLEQCRGCYLCQKRGENFCPIKDDRDKILEMMKKSDAIILASPVYVLHITALMKNFIDRFAFLCHRPDFFGKYALTVATTKGSGLDEVLGYLRKISTLWGFAVVDKFGMAEMPGNNNTEKNAGSAAKKLYSSFQKKQRPIPDLGRLVEFRILKIVLGRKENPADYAFFRDKKRYYYPVGVNVFKMFVPWLMEKLMRKIMRLPSPYNSTEEN